MTDQSNSQFIIYQTVDGLTKLDVRFQNESVWLTQQMMAELFQTSSDNVSLHLKNIYAEAELDECATTEDFSVVRYTPTFRVSNSDSCPSSISSAETGIYEKVKKRGY